MGIVCYSLTKGCSRVRLVVDAPKIDLQRWDTSSDESDNQRIGYG